MKNLVFSVLRFKCKKAAMCGSMRLPGRSCCDFWMKVNYCSRKAIILLSSCFQSLSWVQCSLRWSIMHRNQSCRLENAVFLLCRSKQHCCDRRSSKFPVNFIHPCGWMEQEWKCLLWSCYASFVHWLEEQPPYPIQVTLFLFWKISFLFLLSPASSYLLRPNCSHRKGNGLGPVLCLTTVFQM